MIASYQKYCLILTLISLTACQASGPAGEFELSVKQKPRKLMLTISRNVQNCWFKGANPNFRKFRMANELNSYAGMPRLLLVPKNNPTGLPSLVVQAQSKDNLTRLHVFGPLLATNAGKTISADLKNWTSGKTTCVN
jgi:hypothetical protein